MGKSLFDYSKENLHSENLANFDEKIDHQKGEQNVNTDAIKDAEKLYEKYKDYSTQDLEKEFVSLSKQRLKDGSLSKEKLSSTLSSLTPFLSSSQRDFLAKLVGEIDD